MDKEEYKAFYKEVYRHSLAHILAKAVIEIFGKDKVQYAIGPQIADGMYYDFLLPRTVTNDDFKAIEDKMRSSNGVRTGSVRKSARRKHLSCSRIRSSRLS